MKRIVYKEKFRLVVMLLLAAFVVPLPADDHLRSVKTGFFKEAAAVQPLNLAEKTIFFEVSGVEFSSTWLNRNRTGLDPGYKERTVAQYSAMLKEKLDAQFAGGGVTVVQDRSRADVTGTASISELFVNAPKKEGISSGFARIAGSARFELSIQEAGSQQEIAHLIDSRETVRREFQPPLEQSRGMNTRDFGQLMDRWAKESCALLCGL